MNQSPLKPVPQQGIMAISPYVAGISTISGVDKIVKLSSNENAWGPSPYALEAYKKAVNSLYKYPDGNATFLREALADVYDLPLDQIMTGTGSDEILHLTAHAYAGFGDEVIYSQHGFLVYPIAARMVGAVPIAVAEKELTTQVDAILNAVTPRTKIVYVANPSNPTGTCLPFSELQRLHAGLRSDIVLVLDRAYAEFSQLEGYNAGEALVKNSENVIMTRTFSKVYGLAGLRVGWCYAPKTILDVFHRIRAPFSVNLPAIYAAEAACRDTQWTAEIVRKTLNERKRIEEACISLGVYFTPSEANYLLLHFNSEGDKTSINADVFLKKQGIIVRRVDAYHLPHCLRVSVGTEEQNTAFLEALSQFIKS
jgi:histidinol-phosphate aminotransferase